MPSIAPSIQGLFIIQHARFIQRRASRLSSPASTMSAHPNKPSPNPCTTSPVIAWTCASGKIGSFNRIQVHNHNVGETQQGQVFQDLIAQRSCANHQDMSGANLFLVPPADETETAEPVLGGRRSQRTIHCFPAVISGCRRRMSPSLTAASDSVWLSCTWRPEFL